MLGGGGHLPKISDAHKLNWMSIISNDSQIFQINFKNMGGSIINQIFNFENRARRFLNSFHLSQTCLCTEKFIEIVSLAPPTLLKLVWKMVA